MLNVFMSILAAIAVLPSDRLAMADRLFDKGRYSEAAVEYASLQTEPSIAVDELLFRLAECDRLTGKNELARNRYAELFAKHPDSKHVAQARFLYAMGATGDEHRKLLAELDSDRVDKSTRAAALYHLGVESTSIEMLERCIKLEPMGKYASYARMRMGLLLISSANAKEWRRGIELILDIAFSKSPLAEEALHCAAIYSYRNKQYWEASSLFRRYRKTYPKGEHVTEAESMSAWCDFMQGKFADAAAACGDGKTDDLAYIRAACAYSSGDNERALELFQKYLEDYPNGNYRVDAKLPIVRIELEMAKKSGDGTKIVESAKRGFSLSKLAADELQLAWAFENAGRQDEAIAEYGMIVRNFPDTEEAAEALFRKAMVEMRREHWLAAELALSEALSSGKLVQRKASALYWRGVAAIRVDHEAEGIKFLQEAVSLGLGMDENREARLMIADFDLGHNRLTAATNAYSQLVREGACDRMNAARILAVGRLLGGEDAKICAKALIGGKSQEWQQAGYSLLGAAEEQVGSYTAAIDAYRKCIAVPVKTTEIAEASFRLGSLEYRAGEHDNADATLKQAVALNGDNPRLRAEAYLLLAKNAVAKGDGETAKAYATVVTSLFDDAAIIAEARKILAKGQ